ncbi:thioredoxin family protein [Nocardia paucivorans]|uniref:thioredoxin family protein n=1 Tax=Nocardia paucivorans TaxID=114259 RepID=UPI0002FBB52F|nr:thioredoxin domain-containing protein [Nocardia paucivorans]
MPTTQLTQQTFDRTVSAEYIVLVMVGAAWCEWTKRFAPIYEASSEAHRDIVHAVVDGDAEVGVRATFRIDSYPWLLGFREGMLVYSKSGFLPAAHLEEVVQQIRWMDMETVHRERGRAAVSEEARTAPSVRAGLAPGPVRYGWPGLETP